MTEWIEAFASAMAVPPLEGDEADLLLEASRDVAHRVERRATPLAAFLMGMGVATRTASGMERRQALDQVLEALRDRLPPAPPDKG